MQAIGITRNIFFLFIILVPVTTIRAQKTSTAFASTSAIIVTPVGTAVTTVETAPLFKVFGDQTEYSITVIQEALNNSGRNGIKDVRLEQAAANSSSGAATILYALKSSFKIDGSAKPHIYEGSRSCRITVHFH